MCSQMAGHNWATFTFTFQHCGSIKKTNGKSENLFYLDKNKNITHHILWNATKPVFREKIMVLNPYFRKDLRLTLN